MRTTTKPMPRRQTSQSLQVLTAAKFNSLAWLILVVVIVVDVDMSCLDRQTERPTD